MFVAHKLQTLAFVLHVKSAHCVAIHFEDSVSSFWDMRWMLLDVYNDGRDLNVN